MRGYRAILDGTTSCRLRESMVVNLDRVRRLLDGDDRAALDGARGGVIQLGRRAVCVGRAREDNECHRNPHPNSHAKASLNQNLQPSRRIDRFTITRLEQTA